MHLLIMLFMHN